MKKLLVVTTFLLFAIFSARAQKSEIFVTGNKAIRGYDPIAFFKESKPVKGDEKLSYNWKDATWLFSTQQNLDDFKTSPEKYAPQYGCYCAYGTADGHKAPTQTETWTIVGDKLYFNYNNKVKQLWDKNQKALIEKADQQWIDIKEKP
ncbi:YHS domain protein [Pedobacter sp. PAMC26386]|nr:YHS domain protein [Pedobacter sp. PAMC26386]